MLLSHLNELPPLFLRNGRLDQVPSTYFPTTTGNGLLRIVLPSTSFTSTGSARYLTSSPPTWFIFTFTVPSAPTVPAIYREPISFALAVGKSPATHIVILKEGG